MTDLKKEIEIYGRPMYMDLKPNKKRIEENIKSSYSVATLLTPVLGYEKISEIVKEASEKGAPIIDLIEEKKLIDKKTLKKLITPEVMATPGLPIIED